jgi:2-methylcitrate dehydratase PrpD
VKIESLLAQHVAATTFKGLSPAAIAAAKRSLIDTIVVALGARGAQGLSESMRASLTDEEHGSSTIWHTGKGTSARSAAFVNSIAAAALDFDSIYPFAAVHPDIVVVPVALALSESRSLSGQDLLCAIAVGGDLICRLAKGTTKNSGWFYTSVYGAITAAALTARLLNSSERSVANAMGLGFLNASGTYQPVIERSLSKRALAAFSVDAGVLCGRLAAEGFVGPSDWLTGKHGIDGQYETCDITKISNDIGRVFENAHISIKPYPSCQCNHAALDALLALRADHSLTKENIAEIQVFVSPYMNRLVGAPYSPGLIPQVAAQFSIQYSLARALFDGRLGIAEISDSAACDPQVISFVSRIQVTVAPDNQQNYCPATVRVRKVDGTFVEHTATQLRGSADAPLDEAELAAKVKDCLDAGGYGTREPIASEIVDMLMHIDREVNVNLVMTDLMNLLKDGKASVTSN